MDDSQKIVKLASSLKVLYVEDEDMTREAFAKHLRMFFKDLDLAIDGKDGLEKAKEKKYDIIITDVQMPHMTGLQMIHEIKALGQEVRTIITTAFNDEDYFLDSIAANVDKYIIKPIKIEDLYRSIYDIARIIDNEQKADELRAREAQEKISQTAQGVMEGIANAYPSPTCVINDGKILFINNAFKELLSTDELTAILEGAVTLSDLLVKKSGFESSIAAIQDNIGHNKVMFATQNNSKRIFHTSMAPISMPGVSENCTICSFADITTLEFQKLRVKLYSEMLHDLIMSKQKDSTTDEVHQLNTLASEPIMSASKLELETTGQKASKIISSKEYMSDMDGSLSEQIQDLQDIEEDIDDLLGCFIMKLNTDSLRDLAIKLDMYSRTMDILLEFSSLAISLKNLSIFLQHVTNVEIVQSSGKLTTHLCSIINTLKEWRLHIFTLQDTQNIHYLDNKLLSICLFIQLECNLVGRGDDSASENEPDTL